METISMSRRERKRLEVFSRVQSGEMTLVEASSLLGLSYRQTKRVWSRYQEQGDAGLVHRGRGRASNRQTGRCFEGSSVWRCIASSIRTTVRRWRRKRWRKKTALQVSVSVLRRWLQAAGLWERRRKRRVHRRRRERRSHRGRTVATGRFAPRLVRGAGAGFVRRSGVCGLGDVDGDDRRRDGPRLRTFLRERVVAFGGGCVS